MTEEYKEFQKSIKLTQAVHLYGACCFYVFGLFYFYILDSAYLLTCNFIGGTLCLGNLYAYNRYKGKYLTHTFLFIVYLGLVNISVHVGVKHVPLIFWGMSVPVASTFINEETGTLVWGIFGFLFLPLVLILRNSGFHLGQIPLDDSQNLFFICATYIGLLAFVNYSAFLYKIKLKQTFSLFEKSQNELATLVRVLCHDIGNPIHQIKHFSTRLARSNDQKYYELLQTSINSLDNTLGNVREYVAVTSGKKELPRECISLAESVDEAVSLIGEKGREKSVFFEIRNNCDFDPQVTFEKNSLVNQVLVNLLDNAVKFSTENTTVIIQIDNGSDGSVRLKIKDQGVGISQSKLQMLFEPSAPTTTRGTSGETGSGFGLPIVASYLNSYGAGILIESDMEKSQGTEITVTFPKV